MEIKYRDGSFSLTAIEEYAGKHDFVVPDKNGILQKLTVQDLLDKIEELDDKYNRFVDKSHTLYKEQVTKIKELEQKNSNLYGELHRRTLPNEIIQEDGTVNEQYDPGLDDYEIGQYEQYHDM